MRTVEIKAQTGASTILIGESLDRLGDWLPDDGAVIVTDTIVERLYGERFPKAPVITIGVGEGVKTLETVQAIYGRLLALDVDRSGCLVGIGGGLVCDVAGFAAATYLRGIDCGFVSTTLLSQVDASVGGKNGVNFGGYKNMVGVFRQPRFVICDTALLKTLPRREVLSGLGEVVKHAAIADPSLFEFLEVRAAEALALEPAVTERLVHDSVRIKADVVRGDEKESGRRRVLNFGHTFGHGLELLKGMAHGEAVAAGMVMAAALSVEEGILDPREARRLEALLEGLRLPVRVAADPAAVMDALKKDKKRQGDRVHVVLLEAIGRPRVTALPVSRLEAFALDWFR